MIKRITIGFLLFATALQAYSQNVKQVDVLVYGATSGGIIAAYTAKKLGKSVLLAEPTRHIGGLSSGGLGFTDIGNKYVVTGLSRDFYRRIGKHYGKFEQWIFEPHVAENLFKQYLAAANIDVLYQYEVEAVKKQNGTITEVVLQGTDGKQAQQVVRAKMFIDCSYEGDLMAKAGVSYTVGREANKQYNETYNGVQMLDKHQFTEGVDPYKIPGKPQSGLLWGISDEKLAPQGSSDKKVQTYNFRICLTDSAANRIPITRPEEYDPARYELLLRHLEKKPAKDLIPFLYISDMPNRKTDINNNGPFSTDMIGMNYDYPEASFAERQKIIKQHELYTKGLLYFIGHDERMPAHLRKLMLEWGYPKDEYSEYGNWSPQLYIREARRMVGAYVMTQANCEGKTTVTDGVGMAAYTMDSHNCQRVVVDGMVKNEGDVQQGGFGPYPVSYRSIIPKASECKNLLVPVCLSASHIAYGSIRMEPVFMVLSQSAAVAAVLAVDGKTNVQNVDVKKLQDLLKTNPLADGSEPEVLVDDRDRASLKISGNWQSGEKGGYGPSYLYAQGGKTASVRFIPQIRTAGQYDVYTYLPKIENGAAQTSVTVFDGKETGKRNLDVAGLKVEGQTSGEWLPLGRYTLPKGKSSYIELSAGDATGAIVADAMLFVPVRGGDGDMGKY